ncbi:ABC transporter ATP-binding protein [Gleimia sp. 6138-11-ORH1]|uniref:ABC transporter ATP-binding protein n=1 Tax=Gleimia sp. 6138-11-ORH1 TaxID=2973937 RepID=UPI00216A8688|nr:ABC transporter ATP-binding protein [Gleimia sp. 6138-11-ORH1]MCS4484995.1 ABC transporter ATP-binding protein [Gleimia sp. 6138-11-ORH1]
MSSLFLADLNVHYGTFHAVKHVDLQVPQGQIVALLGASGSGKSSLLRAIAGLETSTGTLQFAQEDLRPIPVHKRHFGLMFQDGQLFGHRSVQGNIEFGLAGESKATKRARVQELLSLVGLSGYENRRISTLSGGQQQRVALARALAPRPRLLLLDEPLSALDRALREQLSAEIRKVVKEQGVSAIYVTHDQQEALAVADRIIVMHAGKILRDASPREIWQHPQYVEVAEFLGFAPLIPADIAVGEGLFPFLKGGALANFAQEQNVSVSEVFVACAPATFTFAERNTPSSCEHAKAHAERNTPSSFVRAKVLNARIGQGVTELEVALQGETGQILANSFKVEAPLEVWESIPAEVCLKVKQENVCLVTAAK